MSDMKYFSHRYQKERALAEVAQTAKARQIHANLALRYAAKITRLESSGH